MNAKQLREFESRLRGYFQQSQKTADSLESEVRGPSRPDALSVAPMHMGDMGTRESQQDMSETLLEHENDVMREVADALKRIEQGTFGRCEACGKAIPKGRLEAIPYARYCAKCAEKMQSEPPVNVDSGRPHTMPGKRASQSKRTATTRSADESELSADLLPGFERDAREEDETDTHAAGTSGGGSAIGGLAGTTIGDGGPDGTGLNEAMGTGEFDVELEEEDPEVYSGRSGGAVGGTPANKRAVGGRTHGGIAPEPGPGDSPTGQ